MLSELLRFLSKSRGRTVGSTYRKGVQYVKIVELLSWDFSLFFRPFKWVINFLFKSVCLFVCLFVLCNQVNLQSFRNFYNLITLFFCPKTYLSWNVQEPQFEIRHHSTQPFAGLQVKHHAFFESGICNKYVYCDTDNTLVLNMWYLVNGCKQMRQSHDCLA